jgi:TolB-like protein/Flp pilus assembly protein TadD
MYTDIAGYSSLSQKNEGLAMQLLEEHRRVVRPFFPKHSGREVKTIGDAFLVEFASALEAVRCAFDIQRSMQEMNRGRLPEKQVQLRIGVHVGDVIYTQSDVYGDAVNVASRIYPLAVPGGICVSQQVYDHVRNQFEFPLASIGRRELKNVEPMEVYRVVMPWEGEAATKEEIVLPRDRIAILPFRNMSPDPNDEYFAEGMTEEVISTVSGISGLKVISRTSAMRYKKTEKTVKEIGRELEVGSVLEGSFRKAGNRIRVTTQLIDVAEDEHLWAQNYDRNLDDVFEVQSDIAKQVADALRVKILSPERELIEKKPTESVEAHTLYLKGVYHLSKFSPVEVGRAIEYFQLACEQDPSFALAYAKAAECYVLNADTALPSAVAIPKAKEYASRALSLDDRLAEVHYALAMIANQYDWDWAKTEESFKKALSLNPSLADAHYYYGWFLAMMGRSQEAVSESVKACELDPMSPIALGLSGFICWVVEEYDKARAWIRRALELQPDRARAYLLLALLNATEGRFEEAVREADEGVKFSDDAWYCEQQAQVYAMSGLNERAREVLDGLLSKKFPGYSSPTQIGAIYYLLSEEDKGWEWMQKAYEARDTVLAMWSRCRTMKAAREDPRFVELLGKMKLT